jgi:HK97 family phage major capsid protein/HK97 family phage prohead protease
MTAKTLPAPTERNKRFQAAEFKAETEGNDRYAEFSFSSEEPVSRYFGDEILSHQRGAVDLSRMNDGAPLLFNHDPDRVLGVVERAWIDGKKGRVRVRFSNSEYASEKMADVKDGILRNVSVGYMVGNYVERNGQFIADNWTPYEVSIVSVPSDPTVGIGRSAEPSLPNLPATANAMDPAKSETALQERALESAKVEAQAEERKRVAHILDACEKHNCRDMATSMIEANLSREQVNERLLDYVAERAAQEAAERKLQAASPKTAPAATPISTGSADIGLSPREVQQFSFVRAINALANPMDAGAREAAAFEFEVSDAAARRYDKAPRGILVPNDVLKRDLTVGNAASAGNLVATDYQTGSFIELLRNAMALNDMGVRTLTGLSGPVSIPRQTSAATAYWVGENQAPTESVFATDQVNMTPKTVAGHINFSRRLMIQASLDVESMVREELATVLGLEMDRTGLYGLGSASEPEGIKETIGINTVNFAAAAPTYAEVVQMETLINADNAAIGTMGYLTNATLMGGFKTTEKATGTAQFIYEPGGTVNGYRAKMSNQVAAGDVFFGVWNQLIMGMWGSLDLVVDPYTLSTAGTVRVTAMQDVDFAVRHPESFARGNDTL